MQREAPAPCALISLPDELLARVDAQRPLTVITAAQRSASWRKLVCASVNAVSQNRWQLSKGPRRDTAGTLSRNSRLAEPVDLPGRERPACRGGHPRPSAQRTEGFRELRASCLYTGSAAPNVQRGRLVALLVVDAVWHQSTIGITRQDASPHSAVLALMALLTVNKTARINVDPHGPQP